VEERKSNDPLNGYAKCQTANGLLSRVLMPEEDVRPLRNGANFSADPLPRRRRAAVIGNRGSTLRRAANDAQPASSRGDICEIGARARKPEFFLDSDANRRGEATSILELRTIALPSQDRAGLRNSGHNASSLLGPREPRQCHSTSPVGKSIGDPSAAGIAK